MEKKPISKETLANLKLKARSNLAASGMKDQIQDQQLIEKEDIDKIGKLKQEGKRHLEIAEEMGVSISVVKDIIKKHFPLQSGVTRFSFKKKEKE
ncbi:MAG: hypothetical protein HOD72_03125 [Opitutae bacterium]|jgi:hypothetical protein|nr:hypothetical protein [Opitutae bacterium]MBT4223438.1 hypothetical protein [Opitutae bacterium]MBT5691818.1 hypothetical protein [Opitutae bacterium]MBT6461964.1 hypothetical protein [Opitutae bacterium]MBT6957528.1 hypothetical protein [Opitutae bacterium]